MLVSLGKKRRNYYFMPQCAFSETVVSELQRRVTRLCRNDRSVVKLRLSEAYSLPQNCSAYEIPVRKACRSLDDFLAIEHEVRSGLEKSGAYRSLAERIYCDSDNGRVSRVDLLFVLTDCCPKCHSDGLLIVW